MKPLACGMVLGGAIGNLVGGEVSPRDQPDAERMQRVFIAVVIGGDRIRVLLIGGKIDGLQRATALQRIVVGRVGIDHSAQGTQRREVRRLARAQIPGMIDRLGQHDKNVGFVDAGGPIAQCQPLLYEA